MHIYLWRWIWASSSTSTCRWWNGSFSTPSPEWFWRIGFFQPKRAGVGGNQAGGWWGDMAVGWELWGEQAMWRLGHWATPSSGSGPALLVQRLERQAFLFPSFSPSRFLTVLFTTQASPVSWEASCPSLPLDCELRGSRALAQPFMLDVHKAWKELLPFLECSSLCYVIPNAIMLSWI